jgi:hypothetical protein
MVYAKSSLFFVLMQQMFVVVYISAKSIGPIFKVKAVQEDSVWTA